jgi:hypothetical protein
MTIVKNVSSGLTRSNAALPKPGMALIAAGMFTESRSNQTFVPVNVEDHVALDLAVSSASRAAFLDAWR